MQSCIFLSLIDDAGLTFHAPDFCVPRELKPTDVSIVVPRNTFAAGKIMDGSLTFSKIGTQDTNSIPDIFAYSSYSKTTTFEARTSGGSQGAAPQITGLSRVTGAGFQFTATGQPNSVLTIQGSADLQTWTTLTSTHSPTGVVRFTDVQALAMPYRFYRVSSQAQAGGSGRTRF